MNANDVTDRQIAQLRREARDAHDLIAEIICDVALGGGDTTEVNDETDDGEGYPDYSGGGHDRADLDKIRGWLRSSQDEARAECARMIAAAQAMAD